MDELLSSFAFWIDALREMLRSLEEQNLEPHVVEAVAESGLSDFYQDVMMWPDFCLQHQVSDTVLIQQYL